MRKSFSILVGRKTGDEKFPDLDMKESLVLAIV
jgi:hypothetical protein